MVLVAAWRSVAFSKFIHQPATQKALEEPILPKPFLPLETATHRYVHCGKHIARYCSVDYLLVFRHAARFDPFAVGLRVIERQFTARVRAFEVVNH